MFMSSRIFLDSSILVESTKGTQTELFEYLIENDTYEMCINQIVLSEYTFYLLIIEGGKAPVTLKRDKTIPAIIEQHNPADFLSEMIFLEPGSAVIPLYLRYMEHYNLLPNDALILATCKLSGITQLASYDTDFAPACLGERIQLVQQISDLA
ncbi:type II toxin-antitoxin system VapC family toxin [Spirosoma migulaei]